MKKKVIFGLLGFSLVVAIICAILLYNGIIWFNNPSQKDYPVRGIDVSSYQGIIDWKVLSQQNIDFVFIKATEGSSFKDKMFEYNWVNANKTKLQVGAYHFFSFDSSGITQAENFISTVPVEEGMLPPVIDFEFYADKEKNPLAKDEALEILDEIIVAFEMHYGQRPIIYATKRSYTLYLEDGYDDYPIWIRDIFRKPNWLGEDTWTFWQYSNRKVLDGYKGKEKYIDMNVFNGTEIEFQQFAYAFKGR
jgi:lysozyme